MKDQLDILLETYKRRANAINELLKKETALHEDTAARLKTKRSLYQHFITDLEGLKALL